MKNNQLIKHIIAGSCYGLLILLVLGVSAGGIAHHASHPAFHHESVGASLHYERHDTPTKYRMAFNRLKNDTPYTTEELRKAEYEPTHFTKSLQQYGYGKVNNFRSSHRRNRLHYSYDAQCIAEHRVKQVKSQNDNSYISYGNAESADKALAKRLHIGQPSRFSEVVLTGKNTNGNARNLIDKYVNPIMFDYERRGSHDTDLDNVMLDGQANGMGVSSYYNKSSKRWAIVVVFNGSPIPKSEVKNSTHEPLDS